MSMSHGQKKGLKMDALGKMQDLGKSDAISLDVMDDKTGFFNRNGFYNFLSNILAIAVAESKNILVFSIKLVNYKKISELWEESESSSIIDATSKLIADVIRGRAVCARIEDDTYMIAKIIADDGVTTANSIKEQFSFRFDNYNKVSSKEYTLNPVITSAVITPDSGMSPDEVLLCLSAKNREVLDSKPQSRYSSLADGEGDPRLRSVINKILDTNDIDYHFQPIISAKTGKIVGYEALMRMPEKYGVSPLTLLKFAAEEKRLGDVERATLFNVLKKVEEFKEELGDRKVFINSIPGHYLPDDEFICLAKKYSDLAEKVVVEVTEETETEKSTIDSLSERSRQFGFQVAVDDFGTGYSNVSNLLKLSPHYVKIDRYLISELQLDPRKQHFVNTIIQFAHDNGFQALAEGVETAEELNAVIRMGVDLIQGFYTARPAPQLLQSLPAELLSDIKRANLDMLSTTARQKVYIVKDEKNLSLIDISLQKYSTLLFSSGDYTLVGNVDYSCPISIRIKEKSDCRLTIRNVCLGDIDATPCIDIGSDSKLTLNIEGKNTFTGNGIRVPASTELKLEGSGFFSIKPTFANAYGIGNDYQYAFGKIVSEMTGALDIDISGENCICIGGRSSDADRAIDLKSGQFKGTCAASKCVGIGSYQGNLPIYISDMDISIDVRIDTGAMIGSMNGGQDTHISNTALRIFGSGNRVVGVGSAEKTTGKILINDCSVDVAFKGWNITAVGAPEGDLLIDCNHCRILVDVEGSIATGMGSRTTDTSIALDNVGLYMRMSSGEGILLGCSPDMFKENQNYYNIERDGNLVERDRWFISMQ